MVLSAVTSDRVQPVLPQLRELARHQTVALGGAAAKDHAQGASGVLLLGPDLVAEAARVTKIVEDG